MPLLQLKQLNDYGAIIIFPLRRLQSIRIGKIFFLAAILFIGILPLSTGYTLSFPSEIKSSVGFIFVTKRGVQYAIGTGFFVGVESPNKKRVFLYFVTAKHVLFDKEAGNWHKGVSIRLNLKDGTSENVPVPIRLSGRDKSVLTHDDANVDLAVIPLTPTTRDFDFKYLSSEMLLDENLMSSKGVREGSDIFFTGLFTPYKGFKKNVPIVRFGKVALLTKEKIPWGNKVIDLILVETGSYGGNSGSPVFLHVGAISSGPEGTTFRTRPQIALLGVMKGSYFDLQKTQEIDLATTEFSKSNMGIAAVIPAGKIKDILFGDELTKNRGF